MQESEFDAEWVAVHSRKEQKSGLGQITYAYMWGNFQENLHGHRSLEGPSLAVSW